MGASQRQYQAYLHSATVVKRLGVLLRMWVGGILASFGRLKTEFVVLDSRRFMCGVMSFDVSGLQATFQSMGYEIAYWLISNILFVTNHGFGPILLYLPRYPITVLSKLALVAADSRSRCMITSATL